MGRFFGYLTAGFTGVLIVGAIAIYSMDATGKIEADLQARADARLAETGLPWASVEIQGRDAILNGEALLPSERRRSSDNAARAIDAIPGIREVHDNTTARFKSMDDLEKRLAESCKRAAADLPAAWLKCAVKGQTVTMSGAALTETARRYGVEKASAAVEEMKARETISDTTMAYYKSSDGMQAAFAGACGTAIAEFLLNWMKCRVDGRRFTLSGDAPVEAERIARVAAARVMLETVRGVEDIADETVSLPAFSSPEACREAIEKVKKDQSVRFAAGAAAIDPQSHALLDALTVVAKRCVGARIEVQGHTENSGNPGADLSLSEAQAAAVAAYMTSRGAPAGRVSARGYGHTRPVAAGDTAEIKAKNRRIDFDVSK